MRFGLTGSLAGSAVTSSFAAVFLLVFFAGVFGLAGVFFAGFDSAGLASVTGFSWFAFATSDVFAVVFAVLVRRVFGLGFSPTALSFVTVAGTSRLSVDALCLAAGFFRGCLAGVFLANSLFSTGELSPSLCSVVVAVTVALVFG